MNDDLSPEETQQIADALAAGRKIEAIKLYRTATGQGLKEAKEFIDSLLPELIAKDPEKYQKTASGSGCASVLLFFCISGPVLLRLLQEIV